jgi:diaminopimelate decarboxylase
MATHKSDKTPPRIDIDPKIELNQDRIRDLAAQFGTPLYIFVESTIRRQCQALKAAIGYPNTVFRYACKALSNTHILGLIKSEGFKIDASSFNEVLRSLKAGFAAEEILYTGEGADFNEFRQMLTLGVHINCSSLDQIRLVGQLTSDREISIRLNPGEGHGHHDKVNTGGPKSKHGIYFSDSAKALNLATELNLIVTGVHTHIGSGTDLIHWLKIKDITLELARRFPQLKFVDLGGGFPVVYKKDDKPMPLDEWGSSLAQSMHDFSKELGREIQLQIEPGRFVVAESGFLLSEVQSFKETPEFLFAIVNTGFNHNPRPVMYGAYHEIEVIKRGQPDNSKLMPYVIAGNLCESGDVFTVNDNQELLPRLFPKLAIGDLMLMHTVGAYSYSMMSEYNSMNLPAAVLLKNDGEFKLIERRGNFEDLLRREVF